MHSVPGSSPHATENAQLVDRLRREISEASIDSDGISVEAEVTLELPGFRSPDTRPLVARSSVTALADAGITSAVTGWTVACDGGFIAADLGFPTIMLGSGGINDQAHQVNESVSIAVLVVAARTYALMCLGHR